MATFHFKRTGFLRGATTVTSQRSLTSLGCRRLVYCCVVWALSTSGGLAQAPAPWIKLEGGPTYKFTAAGTSVSLRIPVTLTPDTIPANDVILDSVAVRFNDFYDSNFTEAFGTPTLTTTPRPGILLTIDTRKAPAQGTYQVSLRARPRNAALNAALNPALKPLSLDIQIVHPPATLRSMGTLVVERALPRRDGDGASGVPAPMTLQETSGVSNLTGITIRSLGFSHAAHPSMTGDMEFDKVAGPVPPNGTFRPTYTLTGEFPLGTSRGPVEVTAPQLAAPLSLNMEVRTRCAWWLMIFPVALGVLIGFLVRTYLKHRIERLEAIDRGNELLRRMDEARRRHPDKDFHQELDAPQQELRDAINSLEQNLKGLGAVLKAPDATRLNQAIQAADDALRGALTRLDTRRAATQSNVGVLEQLTGGPWIVPSRMHVALSRAHNQLAEPIRLLGSDDVGGAQNQWNQISRELMEELVNAWGEWKANVVSPRLQELAAPTVALPSPVVTVLQPTVGQAQTLLDSVSANLAAVPSTEEVTSLLQSVQNVGVNLRDLVRQVASWLLSVQENVNATLWPLGARLPDRKALDQLQDAVTNFVARLRKDAEQGVPTLDLFAAAPLGELQKTWSASLQAQAAALDQADKDTVTALIDGREYPKAAREIAKVLSRTAAIARGASLADANAEAEQTPPVISRLGSWWPSRETAPPMLAPISVVRVEALSPPVTVPAAAQQLATARLWQTILVGILIVLVSVALYADKFIGTSGDFLGLFFWGFGLDLSADTLVQKASLLKVPS